MRWDRIARLMMLLVLVVLLFLAVSAGRAYLTTRSKAAGTRTQIALLARDNARLRARRNALLRPPTLALEARQLGLVRPGERAYAIPTLPRN